ncbi:MAG: hypothetical protein MPW14_11380 [Candidatus Manganitrophus sp.]|nr:MAG: hypothetical protein MPW14_11380 [Candidatus Manganitrophus sp.]
MKRKKNPALPWNQLKTYSVKQRPSKVKKEEFAKPLAPNPGIQAFLDSLPRSSPPKTFARSSRRWPRPIGARE